MRVNLSREGSLALLGIAYDGIPCFTMDLLPRLVDVNQSLDHGHGSADFQVLYSEHPRIFSLGGDLRAFVDAARKRNASWMNAYAWNCMKLLVAAQSSRRLNVALVQGQALGGGWECILANDYVIAEKRARFGFPERTFNTFPGMGAISLLTRKVGRAAAVEITCRGKVYTAEELHAMGLVDVLVEDGEGWTAVDDLQRMSQCELSVRKAQKLIDPIPEREVSCILQSWIARVLTLGEGDLGLMERMASSQEFVSNVTEVG